jgi:hypothetical protein
MENLPNPLAVLLNIEKILIDNQKRDERIEKRIVAIEKLLAIKTPRNDFDIVGLESATKILHCGIDKLREAIKNRILVQDRDYRFNGRRTYTFSHSSLQQYKGKL